MWHLENSYKDQLPDVFYSEQAPIPPNDPVMVYFNQPLADELGIGNEMLDHHQALGVFSGKEVLAGTYPIAQAYAGHQFGQFNMLGDGRAVLLGEHKANGKRYDIQLKGSGATKYSRNGDGRATLSSMLREYLMSEAMHHLGIPTTRSLAVVKTGNPVYREDVYEGGVLTRISESHIRVGTFEYARFFCTQEQLDTFTQYVIKRHYPELLDESNYALALLKTVMERQAALLVNWMRVGFVHGVMNTDNMSVVGETIDYGPCAFMNAYHQGTLFSSIDKQGRYAYGNQPPIAHWNLSILANALLPIINENKDTAISEAQALLNTFPTEYTARYQSMMCCKLGIAHEIDDDKNLIEELLKLLEAHKVDYTNFFVSLRTQTLADSELMSNEKFIQWHQRWQVAHNRFGDQASGLALMEQYNPVVIPRNHLVEQALSEATEGNLTSFENLLNLLSNPYNSKNEMQTVPDGYDQQYQTFCGT